MKTILESFSRRFVRASLPVHSTPEKFETGGFILKKRQMFSVHTTSQIFHQSLWICVWGKLGQRNHVIIVTSSFSKSYFTKCFSSRRKRKASVYKFLRCEERFRDGLVWKAGGLTVDIKPRCQIPPAQCGASDFWERVYFLCKVVKPSIENHTFSGTMTKNASFLLKPF